MVVLCQHPLTQTSDQNSFPYNNMWCYKNAQQTTYNTLSFRKLPQNLAHVLPCQNFVGALLRSRKTVFPTTMKSLKPVNPKRNKRPAN